MSFEETWDIEGTVQYLVQRRFARPALQFPDEYLPDCKLVAEAVQALCNEAGHPVEVPQTRWHNCTMRLRTSPAALCCKGTRCFRVIVE
jgi:diphthamide synthase subunit DPH2